MYTIGVKPRFASGGRTAIGRAAAIRIGRVPKFRVHLRLHIERNLIRVGCVTPKDAKLLIYWNRWFLKRLRAGWWSGGDLTDGHRGGLERST